VCFAFNHDEPPGQMPSGSLYGASGFEFGRKVNYSPARLTQNRRKTRSGSAFYWQGGLWEVSGLIPVLSGRRMAGTKKEGLGSRFRHRDAESGGGAYSKMGGMGRDGVWSGCSSLMMDASASWKARDRRFVDGFRGRLPAVERSTAFTPARRLAFGVVEIHLGWSSRLRRLHTRDSC